MGKLLLALSMVMMMATTASASLLRIELTRGNRATAPVSYELKTTAVHGMVIVAVELPRAQAALAHLWRIDVVLRKGKGTLLSAPLATTVDGDRLRFEVILDPKAMKDAEIWIRTGEHAPLAETVYAIVLRTFR
jgi:hypothetical protein